jgi:hypothetical protein
MRKFLIGAILLGSLGALLLEEFVTEEDFRQEAVA